jgi:hypothetical protein
MCVFVHINDSTLLPSPLPLNAKHVGLFLLSSHLPAKDVKIKRYNIILLIICGVKQYFPEGKNID